MNKLEKMRIKISKLDMKMKKLFLKRMEYSLEVKKIKDELGLDYFDKERENFMKESYSKDIESFKEEYLVFLDKLLEISKGVMKK